MNADLVFATAFVQEHSGQTYLSDEIVHGAEAIDSARRREPSLHRGEWGKCRHRLAHGL